MLLVPFVNFCRKELSNGNFNKEMESWVIENKVLITTMSRYELIELPYYEFKAAYEAMTPDKKYELWQDKLVEEIKLRGNPDEIEHIYNLSIALGPDAFANDQSRNDFLDYCKVWMQEGIEKFDWQLVDVGLITMTLYPSSNFGEYHQKAIKSKRSTMKSYNIPPACDCKWGWFCRCRENPCLEGSLGVVLWVCSFVTNCVKERKG